MTAPEVREYVVRANGKEKVVTTLPLRAARVASRCLRIGMHEVSVVRRVRENRSEVAS